jgi:outer membrane protein OmpA-like peptidoglycan-associated protein
VNTTFDEVKPVVSVDGRRLFFSRQYAPTNLGGTKDMLDIYFSDLINGSWSEAQNIGSPLNNLNPNGVASVTADGRNLLLINRYRKDGLYDLGLSITESKNGTWQYPQDVNIEDFVNTNDFVDYSLSPNGDVLIMAIQNKESLGDQDLYVSFYKGDNSWTKPQNLGAVLNTGKEDFSPFIAPDGVTLYFASAGHGGLGGSDIFYTRRLDDTWLNWSEPINMGEAVNTVGFDGYFSISANTNIAYVVSQTGGRANSRDIYQVRIPPELTPQESYMLIGTVYDASTNNPLSDAEVAIAGGMIQRPNVLRTDETGGYKVMLPKKGDFNASVTASGYESLNEALAISQADKDKLEVRNDFFLKPIEAVEPQAVIAANPATESLPLSNLTASISDKPVITELPKYEEKEMPTNFLEEEKIYNLYFKVVDAVTNKEIPHSRLVFGLDALEEEPLSVNNNLLGQYSRQMTMDESTIYLKAEAAGYETERKVIPPDDWKNRMDKEFIIYLNPIPEDEMLPQVADVPESNPTSRLLESYNLNGVTTKPRGRILEVSGTVFDSKTRKPIPASVKVASQQGNEEDLYKANLQGFFKLSNPGWDTYNVEIFHEGYYTKKEALHIERVLDERGIARVVYYLDPIEKGEKITLNNLWFIQSTPELVEFSFPVLDSLGQVMINNPSLEIKLSGHTDGIGDPQKNQNLSELRVEVIKEYIVSMGVHPKRIRTEAFGSRFPIASNAREETRKLNRRVEVTILKY